MTAGTAMFMTLTPSETRPPKPNRIACRNRPPAPRGRPPSREYPGQPGEQQMDARRPDGEMNERGDEERGREHRDLRMRSVRASAGPARFPRPRPLRRRLSTGVESTPSGICAIGSSSARRSRHAACSFAFRALPARRRAAESCRRSCTHMVPPISVPTSCRRATCVPGPRTGR